MHIQTPGISVKSLSLSEIKNHLSKIVSECVIGEFVKFQFHMSRDPSRSVTVRERFNTDDKSFKPRESSRTLVRPSLHCSLHRRIGHHGLGLGAVADPRDHEIECRLVGLARNAGDDLCKGAQVLSLQPASECRSTKRSYGQALPGQHVRSWSSP